MYVVIYSTIWCARNLRLWIEIIGNGRITLKRFTVDIIETHFINNYCFFIQTYKIIKISQDESFDKKNMPKKFMILYFFYCSFLKSYVFFKNSLQKTLTDKFWFKEWVFPQQSKHLVPISIGVNDNDNSKMCPFQ